MTATQRSTLIGPFPSERRGEPRHQASTVARLDMRLGRTIVDILDLSRSGACFALRQGLAPSVGSIIRLAPLGLEATPGLVVWTRGDRFGVQLDYPLENLELWLDPAAHGHDYLTAIVRLQRGLGG